MNQCKIACNFTNELIALMMKGICEVDYIKWPSFPPKDNPIEEVAKYGKPVLLHGFMGYANYYVSSDKTLEEETQDAENAKALQEASDRYGVLYYSAHIGGFVSKMQGVNWENIYCSPEDEEKLVQQTVKNIKKLK